MSIGGEAKLVEALAVAGNRRGAAHKAARNALIEQLVDGKDEDEAANITGEAKNGGKSSSEKKGAPKWQPKAFASMAAKRTTSVQSGLKQAWQTCSSVVFTRGETQVVTATLGVDRMLSASTIRPRQRASMDASVQHSIVR